MVIERPWLLWRKEISGSHQRSWNDVLQAGTRRPYVVPPSKEEIRNENATIKIGLGTWSIRAKMKDLCIYLYLCLYLYPWLYLCLYLSLISYIWIFSTFFEDGNSCRLGCHRQWKRYHLVQSSSAHGVIFWTLECRASVMINHLSSILSAILSHALPWLTPIIDKFPAMTNYLPWPTIINDNCQQIINHHQSSLSLSLSPLSSIMIIINHYHHHYHPH